HRAYAFRCNRGNEHDNKERVREIVNLRLELANLLGYREYASYKLETKMALNTGRVTDLLEKLHEAARPVALDELAEVAAFARESGAGFDLQAWDWAYYSEKLKEQKYGFREEMLKPFFELNRVIDGIFLLANRLFGVTFTPVDNLPLYHPDVRTFEVADHDGRFLALFYADFFPRKGKQGGAWMTEFRGQWKAGGKEVRPHISIVCNFSKPTGDKPSLLTFDEVNTFLHEFGHALHGILSDVVYPSVSGTNVYQDFVELPSQVLENWLVEKEWLDLFARHYQTGEPIPQELIDKLIEARNFLEGYATERQLGFGLADLAWHTITEPFSGDVIAFDQSASEKTRLFPPLEGTSVAPAFSHIFAGGYAAGYYGYKWAEVLDADAFSLFRQEGVFNPEVARSFRVNILERGGSEHPLVLYKRFRGQDPDVTALLLRSGLLRP
ncbi:MAG: M3 family metallopeptidase, partial [Bacteroidales bacterium]